VVLGIRTAMNIYNIIRYAVAGRVVPAVVFSIIGVIGIIFIGWCLAKIAQMRGRRRVFKIMLVSFSSPLTYSDLQEQQEGEEEGSYWNWLTLGTEPLALRCVSCRPRVDTSWHLSRQFLRDAAIGTKHLVDSDVVHHLVGGLGSYLAS
jgi:hypothetical protein